MTELPLEQNPNERCGFIALIGPPNAGKSTFLNALVGAKISIVTRKAQTTRAQIRGILTHDDAQMIFVDTPGVFRPKRRLDRAMVQSAWASVEDADLVALIVDAAKGITPELQSMLDQLKQVNQRIILVLNKTDLITGEPLLKLAQELNDKVDFDQTFMISALSGSGVSDFVEWSSKQMPLGPMHFPPDQISDMSLAVTSAELVREKIFERVHDEIPYNVTVEVEKFEITDRGDYRINQVIYVTRDSHKKILLGSKGSTIKTIGAAARKELVEIFETKVHLFLFVKVRAKWADDPERYEQMGLEFSK